MLPFVWKNFPDKKVLFFFDRDGEGHKGAVALARSLGGKFCKPTAAEIAQSWTAAQGQNPGISRDTVVKSLCEKKLADWIDNSSWKPFKDKNAYDDFTVAFYPPGATQTNVTVHFLPPKTGAAGDFLIEDYFSFPDIVWDKILKQIFYDGGRVKNLSLNELPNAKKRVKNELVTLLPKLTPNDSNGFRVLLDKIKANV